MTTTRSMRVRHVPAPSKRRAVPVRGRILVLGAGFIGAPVVRELVQAGYQVDVLTRSAVEGQRSLLLTHANVVVGDVMSMGAVAGLLTEVDHVVYSVGSSSPSESGVNPGADVSAVLPPLVQLLELLRLRPSVGLTYLSSGGAVYGNAASPLVHEDIPPEPISSYGILKMTSEKYLQMYADLHGIPVRILRVANAYGPGQSWEKGQGIVPRLLRCAQTGQPFPVFGDGESVRDYIYVDDIAEVTAGLVDSPDGHRVLNVGSGIGHSILDLVRLVEQQTGRPITVDFRPARSFDVRSNVLDIQRLQQAHPFHPLDIATGLHRTWQSMSEVALDDLPVPASPRSPTAA